MSSIRTYEVIKCLKSWTEYSTKELVKERGERKQNRIKQQQQQQHAQKQSIETVNVRI